MKNGYVDGSWVHGDGTDFLEVDENGDLYLHPLGVGPTFLGLETATSRVITVAGPGGLIDHNTLLGLQGGDAVALEYYHLDATDYGDLTDLNAQLAALQTDGAPTFAGLTMGGDIAMGGNNITGVGTVDGVDVSAHAGRHENGGADEIDVTDLSGLLADAQTPIAHAMLSAYHSDAAVDAVTRGSLIVGNATPAWDELTIGAAGTLLRSDGTDAAWATLATAGIQPLDATLTSLALLGTAADKMAYTTGVDTWAETAITAFGRSLVDDADAGTARTTLGLAIGTNVQAYDAFLTSIALLGTAADKMIYTTGVDTAAETALTAFARTILDDANAAAALTTLGGADLASLAGLDPGAGDVGKVVAVSAANTYTLAAGAAPAAHDLLSATHSDTAADAVDRGSLIVGNATPKWDELVIGAAGTLLRSDGNDVAWATLATAGIQPLDATLTSLALLGTAADLMAYTTGIDTWAETSLTAFGRSLIDDANQAAGQATLGVVPGTNVQAYDAFLLSIAALGTAADKIIYTTAADTAAEAAITAFGRSLIDDANAAGARTTIELSSVDSPTFAGLTLAGNLAMGGNDITGVGDVDGVDVSDHSARHENGGADEISVAGLSGVLADAQTPTAHDLLSATHGDTSADAVTRGSLIYGNATPAWDELVVGAANSALVTDGTDVAWDNTPTFDGLTLAGNLAMGGNDITGVGDVDGVDVSAHAARHQNGGADEISVAGLSGQTADPQTVEVVKNSGAVVSTRPQLNFIEGANVTLTIADDAGNDQADITIASAGGVAAHDLLSATHSDTAADAVTRGSLIVGNATPKWDELVIGAAGTLLRSDGNDAAWATLATAGIQPLDATLTSLALLGTAADKMAYKIGRAHV